MFVSLLQNLGLVGTPPMGILQRHDKKSKKFLLAALPLFQTS